MERSERKKRERSGEGRKGAGKEEREEGHWILKVLMSQRINLSVSS